MHNKINKSAKAGSDILPPLTSDADGAMPLYEYSKWDGTQQFLPQSADKVFDQLAEFLLQHGERVLRNMDELEDEMPEIVELIQKEGLIEKDREGKWRVTPRGVRQDPGPRARRPVPDLSPRFARPPRHAGERRGHASRSRTRGRMSTATRWPT